jgi:hypothetical protein
MSSLAMTDDDLLWPASQRPSTGLPAFAPYGYLGIAGLAPPPTDPLAYAEAVQRFERAEGKLNFLRNQLAIAEKAFETKAALTAYFFPERKALEPPASLANLRAAFALAEVELNQAGADWMRMPPPEETLKDEECTAGIQEGFCSCCGECTTFCE